MHHTVDPCSIYFINLSHQSTHYRYPIAGLWSRVVVHLLWVENLICILPVSLYSMLYYRLHYLYATLHESRSYLYLIYHNDYINPHSYLYPLFFISYSQSCHTDLPSTNLACILFPVSAWEASWVCCRQMPQGYNQPLSCQKTCGDSLQTSCTDSSIIAEGRKQGWKIFGWK